MEFLELSALTAAICNLTLAVYVFTRDFNSKLNRAYLFWGLSVAIWNIGAFFLFRVESPEQALIWAYVLQVGVIFLPATNFHLCMLIAQYKIGNLVVYIYFIHTLLAISLVSGKFIVGVRDAGFAFYSIAGQGFYLFIIIYAFTSIVAIYLLIKKHKQVNRKHRKRISMMLTAISILIFFGTFDMLPILGILYYPFTNITIYPLGNTASVLYVLLIGYSVLHHQILDIHFALSRYSANIVRFLFTLLIGFILFISISILYPATFTINSFFLSFGVLVATLLISFVLFPRFYGNQKENLEKILLGDKFEYHDKIADFTREIPFFQNKENLIKELDLLFSTILKVNEYNLIIKDDLSSIFTPIKKNFIFDNYLKREHITEIISFFQKTNVPYLSTKLPYSYPGLLNDEFFSKDFINHFAPELCFPLRIGDEYLGFLLLGTKNQDDSFTPVDFELLIELTTNLSYFLANLRLKNQITFREEMDLIGVISSGLAHDLNNLFTPIQTFFQLLDENEPSIAYQLKPIAKKNIKTIKKYIDEARFLSQNSKISFKKEQLKMVIDESIANCSSKKIEKNINFITQIDKTFFIDCDNILLQRLFVNIINNSIDASLNNSKLYINVSKYNIRDRKVNWYKIEFVDEGVGIKNKDKINVFKPYFSTKSEGDKNRGLGLGLAISKKIVQLHGGEVKITSSENVGTTVAVELPEKQYSSNIAVNN